jgi:hypothetical protein
MKILITEFAPAFCISSRLSYYFEHYQHVMVL